MARPDPWLVEGALVVRSGEAYALWPLIQRGIGEWTRMGAATRLEQVGDLLARWRVLAELHDQQLTGSAVGSVVSGDGADRSDLGPVVPRVSASAAAEQLNCSTRWVRRLCTTGELDAHRGVGGCWNITAASVAAYKARTAA